MASANFTETFTQHNKEYISKAMDATSGNRFPFLPMLLDCESLNIMIFD